MSEKSFTAQVTADAVLPSRRQRTRTALTDAASGLIAEKGVEGLRIQEITERADAMFETIVHRSALTALEDGCESGRFDIGDPNAALVFIVGGALATVRAVLDGRMGEGVDRWFAESVLRSLGLRRADAVTTVQRAHVR
jgi:hypothetical protein